MSAKRGVTLYRNILKAHRAKLPYDLCQIGNAYVKNEFVLHKDVTRQEILIPFYEAWDKYLVKLNRMQDKFGVEMSANEKKALSPEMKEKLQELKRETESTN